jgi:aromatic-L-amino-acid decarboxylase
MPLPLEPDPDQRRDLLDAVTAFLDEFYSSLPDLPLFGTDLDSDQTARLSRPPSEEGRPIDEVLDLVGIANRPGAMHPAAGHMAYIPNGGLYTGAVGAFLAAGLNRYTGVVAAAPGFARLETTVIAWLRDLFELPESAAGVLLSGGSMANFTALVAARTARLAEEFTTGTIYVTPHAHHSIEKAARLAGFPTRRVRIVPVDADLRMDTRALVAMIVSDRAEGLAPFLVVGSAGTTDTGAIDPLADLASIARDHGMWLHIDGAYGGFFQLTERGRKRLVGLGAADSITLDPHKGLSIPFGVGALLVRDRATLTDANEGKGAYLQDQPDNGGGDGALDFSSLGPELTRPFRGLHVWLPLQLHGVAAFRAELDRMLDLADHAHRRLREFDFVEKVWRPDLSIVAFECFDDVRARDALASANASNRIAISSTSIEGRYTIRLALLNRRTERRHVDEVLDLIAQSYRR